MTRPLANIAASVRDRLRAHTRRKNGDFQLALTRYVIERFLYRLGESAHRDRFVLKGAMLFVLWDTSAARPTKDLDLAGYWANDAASLVKAIKEILAVPCPEDGMTFADTVTAEPIRHRSEYHGFRLVVVGHLAGAKVALQIDVGFGDAVEPAAIFETYPVVLDAPAPRIRAYPREAAIAEKLHAMVTHGLVNTRLKDFYDVYVLSARCAFAGHRVAGAISATFTRRKATKLEAWPVALTSAFYEDTWRAEQWRRFLQRSKLDSDAPADFAVVGERVRAFLGAPLRATQVGNPFTAVWRPADPWQWNDASVPP